MLVRFNEARPLIGVELSQGKQPYPQQNIMLTEDDVGMSMGLSWLADAPL